MPKFTRMARSCVLTLVAVGASASTLALAPAAQGVDDPTGSRPIAFAMSDAQLEKYDKSLEARRERAAQRFATRLRTATQTALSQRGDAYAWGGVGPNAFDCSGLIFFSYRNAGFKVPRTSGALAAYTHRVAKQDMRRGDLMFFHSGGNVYHASIFLGFQHGRAMMVHSPGSGRSVTVAAPWTSSWFGGRVR